MENNEDIKELIIARLEILPDDKSISIGSEGKFTIARQNKYGEVLFNNY